MTSTGSPGTRWMSRKTPIDTSSKTGKVAARRRATKRSISSTGYARFGSAPCAVHFVGDHSLGEPLRRVHVVGHHFVGAPLRGGPLRGVHFVGNHFRLGTTPWGSAPGVSLR